MVDNTKKSMKKIIYLSLAAISIGASGCSSEKINYFDNYSCEGTGEIMGIKFPVKISTSKGQYVYEGKSFTIGKEYQYKSQTGMVTEIYERKGETKIIHTRKTTTDMGELMGSMTMETINEIDLKKCKITNIQTL